MEQIEIKSQSLKELKETVAALGEKPFRAKQLYEWIHQKLAVDFEEMTNLSKAFREKLKQQCVLTALETLEVQTSKIDGTQKYLFALSDGNVVESVLMKYKHGNSVCISSQVGCKMGCRFCASAIGGWTRNLLPSEMLDQIYRIQQISGERVSNVVVMGTGEPLDNYDNFVNGAEDGMRTVVSIAPTLIGLMVAVGVLRASGFLDFIAELLSGVCGKLGIPASIVPLIIVRLFSSSAATGLSLDIFKQFGTDSYTGLITSILMGCTETVFYTMSVYYMAARIKKTRWTLAGALIATAAGIAASVILARYC